VVIYDLDVVISVGYRIKSERGVQFRRWASNVLRQHLVQGYTLNRACFEQNAAELEQALALIVKTARSPASQRALAQCGGRSGHQRYRLGCPDLAGCGIRPQTERDADSADYEHAGGARRQTF
jgi:hypothetical protein